ncbi:hypothetical protein DFH28DRAFT_931577 [Melampsora americana]|nr:hypothetical protein DFH28DRAFT_931577 [Melampsora americana]
MPPKKKVSITHSNSLKNNPIEQTIPQSISSSSQSSNLQQIQQHDSQLESSSKQTNSEKRKSQLRSAQRTFTQRKKQREKLISSQLKDANNLNREMRDTLARSEAEREVLRQYVSEEVLEEANKRFPISTPLDKVLSSLPGYNSPNLDSFNDLLITPITNRSNRDSSISTNDENPTLQSSSTIRDRSYLGNPEVLGKAPIPSERPGVDERIELEETEPLTITSNDNLTDNSICMNKGHSAFDVDYFESYGSPPDLQFNEGWGEFWETHYEEIEEDQKESPERTDKTVIQNNDKEEPEKEQQDSVKEELTGEEKRSEVDIGHDSAMEGSRGGTEYERGHAIQDAGGENDLAQPMPKNWRPPNLTKGESVRQMLRGTQAWGRLMSHPLASQCDSDELARALQKQAKCANGSPVVSRDDVMRIWLSIPGRIKGKKAGYKLGEDGRGDVDLGD